MEVGDILAKLVSFPTLGGQSNLEIANWILGFLEQRGVEVHRAFNEQGDKLALHCRFGPAVDGGLILSGHMDVVPVEGQDWTRDPFELVEKDNLYFGRGTCDMKGFLACCLSMTDSLQSANLKKPIYFAFSFDEEIGCQGAPMLIEHIKSTYRERPSFAVIGEPTCMVPTIGQKGICIYETTVNGSAGHSSRIKTEVSAVHEASRLIIWLEDKMNDLIQKGQMDDRFNPAHTSIHVGMIQGGIAPNIVADTCTFTWDVRTIPSDSLDGIKLDFDEYCKGRVKLLRNRFDAFNIRTTEFHPAVPALDTSANSEITTLVKTLVEFPTVNAVSYAAEAGQFSEAGFQSIICGPGDIAQAHRADEFVEIPQLEKCRAFIKKLKDNFSE
ncbi:MAG: acetylornithine deacetylase [Cyclobacteriaceae bacterium]